jgi:hypothetical protein
MPQLSYEVIEAALRRVHLYYADRDIIKYWNDNREEGEPKIFTGYYWSAGWKEGGPFKTKGAAIRDAYYQVVLEREPPIPFSNRDKKNNVVDLAPHLRRAISLKKAV